MHLSFGPNDQQFPSFSKRSLCFLSATSTLLEPVLQAGIEAPGQALSFPQKEFACSLRRKAPVSVGIDAFSPSQHYSGQQPSSADLLPAPLPGMSSALGLLGLPGASCWKCLGRMLAPRPPAFPFMQGSSLAGCLLASLPGRLSTWTLAEGLGT